MFDNSDTLERMISPLEMLERMRVPVHGGGGNYSTTCPFCGADCWVNSNSFLCRNDLCVFLAGSVLDMAVGFSKPRNYVSAMHILRKHFGKVLDSEGLTERADVQLVDEARKRRRLMRAVRKMHQQQDINGQRAMLLASLQKQGIHDPGHHLFGVLLRSEQDWLRDLLLGLDMEVTELPDADLLTVPYWADHHLLSALVLLDPRKRGEVLIEFHPAKLAFAGMHMITPDLKQLHLHDSPVHAGKANATRAQESGQAGVAFLLGKGERMSPAVPDMVLHELLKGFSGPKARAQIIDRFAALPLLQPDRGDHIEAAALRNTCRQAGVQIGTVDAVLAQLCIRHDLTLLTTDLDFTHAARHCALRVWAHAAGG